MSRFNRDRAFFDRETHRSGKRRNVVIYWRNIIELLKAIFSANLWQSTVIGRETVEGQILRYGFAGGLRPMSNWPQVVYLLK
jgi:hypothetical protein